MRNYSTIFDGNKNYAMEVINDFASTDFEINPGVHNEQDIIWIRFKKDFKLIAKVKKLVGSKWSNTQKAWYVPDKPAYREVFGLALKIKNFDIDGIHPVNQKYYSIYVEQLKLLAYSENTLKTYTTEFGIYLKTLKSVSADKIDPERLRSYFLYCIETLRLSENTIHSRLNAIKFFYEQILHREKFFYDIPRPQRPEKLPKVLNENEIKRLFAGTNNLKHKMILMLTYGMGLRVSEVVKLKISDIDSNRMQVFIEAAKGKKDRYVNLPNSILADLRKYYKEYQPKKYLFEGQYSGQYTTRSVQAVFKTAMKHAKINKRIGVHGLRHSYATHLLEAGTDMAFIQSLLGHNDIKTTMVYAKVGRKEVQKVKSPLDRM